MFLPWQHLNKTGIHLFSYFGVQKENNVIGQSNLIVFQLEGGVHL